MAEEKKPGKAAQFLGRHGEKVALAACLLGLLAYLVFGLALAKEDPSTQTLKQKIARISAELRKAHDDAKAPEAQPWGERAREPWTKIASVDPPKNDWGPFLRTEIREKTYKKPEVPKRAVKHPSIALEGTEVSLDGVTLSWSATGFTAADMSKERATTDFLKLSHFMIEREVAGSGKWEVLEGKVPAPPPPKTSRDIPPISMKYRDTRIEPKTRYNYRVTSFLDPEELAKLDPKKVKIDHLPKDGRLETVATGSPVATLGIWNLRFVNMMKGQAYIEIEKFDRQHGRVRIAHIHYAGDRIGWWKHNPQDEKEEPTADHQVSLPGGKRVAINFNTGMVLKSVEPRKVTLEVPRCLKTYEPHVPVLEKVQIETIEVVYTDEDGKDQQFYHPPPEKHPLAQPRTCPEHGGARPAAAPPRETPKKEEPAEDPKAAAARKLEAEAEKLFQEAEKAEQRNDKSGAISRYEKLLKDFKDTEFVSKHKKGIIEDKLKKLKGG